MKTLVKQADGSYQLVDGSLIESTAGAIIKPLTFQPVTGAQGLIFGAGCIVTGLFLGKMFGHKIPLVNKVGPDVRKMKGQIEELEEEVDDLEDRIDHLIK